MKQSVLFAPTLRETPAEAEAAAHRLLLRAGYIRQLASGVYAYLPLGRRVLLKLERIIREEMERAGATELLLSALQPAEPLRASGRYDVYGPELFRLDDRHGREFALAPTHEEAITLLVKREIGSYKKLPLTLYQLQTKFRDERRPRFGLLRTREFLMKDAYSFHADADDLQRVYDAMLAAYRRIFTRVGLRYIAVEADAGAIGGDGGSHEFMALAEAGEDVVALCRSCGYAANVEAAETAAPARTGGTARGKGAPAGDSAPAGEANAQAAPRERTDGRAGPQKVRTPDARTIEQVAAFFRVPPSRIVKTLLYLADGEPVAVALRGDHAANEIKLRRFLQANALELADEAAVRAATGTTAGYVGPVGLKRSVRLLVDRDAAAMDEAIAGANEAGYHLSHVVPGRDFPLAHVGDFRHAADGDGCPHCGEPLATARGIEIGHVFKLGDKYSAALDATFLDADGRARPIVMGCYGIGVSRLLAAVVEQRHDADGMLWPAAIAPYEAHIVRLTKDAAAAGVAERLYAGLLAAGVEALYDDRDERPGVKLKDADLIGLPVRIVVGRSAADGVVEVKARDGEMREIAAGDAPARVLDMLGRRASIRQDGAEPGPVT